MINIMHHNRYWTEYVDFLLSDTSQFSLIASPKAIEDYNKDYILHSMDKYQKEKHRIILSCGRLQEPTHENKIIMRFLHSPGFYVYPMIRTYADLLLQHKNSDYRFLILEEYYRAAVKANIEDATMDHFRFLLMNDPKVIRLKVDPTLYKFKESITQVERKSDTALISFSSRLIDYDFFEFVSICKELKKKFKLNILLHPLMRLDEKVFNQIKSLQGELLESIFYNLTKSELVDLYDQHEFIITDGSGSCYEAMLRGCKPLAVHQTKFIASEEKFNEILNEDYLPFPSYRESYLNFDYITFQKKYFEYLYKYSAQEAIAIAKEEILNVHF